jgi:hypothetical protein
VYRVSLHGEFFFSFLFPLFIVNRIDDNPKENAHAASEFRNICEISNKLHKYRDSTEKDCFRQALVVIVQQNRRAGEEKREYVKRASQHQSQSRHNLSRTTYLFIGEKPNAGMPMARMNAESVPFGT